MEVATATSESVPSVDLACGNRDQLRAEIAAACTEGGYFYLVGHGIDAATTDGLLAAMRAFFESDAADKAACMRSRANPWGFYDRELTKNRRDRKEIFDCGPDGDKLHATPWPELHPELRQCSTAFYRAVETVALELVGLVAESLDTPASGVEGSFAAPSGSFLRLNYYPVIEAGSAGEGGADAPLGVHRHTDAGAITLLLQDDESALEVCKEGRWQAVAPRRGALLVNIGDVVQVWSNDRYRACLHRVQPARSRRRYSAPFFLNPRPDAHYAPLPPALAPNEPPAYQSISWAEFRKRRADGDYGEEGADVQIADYRASSSRELEEPASEA